jgi:hypothetical protein
MSTLVTSARAIVGHALAWTAIWMTLMFAIGQVVLRVDPASIDPGEEPWRMALMVSGVGLASGMVFGLLLRLLERGKVFADVAAWRVVLWAALAGAAMPLLTPMNDKPVVNTVPFGIIAALVCLGVARSRRRARPATPALPA